MIPGALEHIGLELEDVHDPLDGWQQFAAHVRARLEQGRRDYGDKSFSDDPEVLLGQLRQELFDIAGWGYVLSVRIDRIERALRSARLQRDTQPCTEGQSELEW